MLIFYNIKRSTLAFALFLVVLASCVEVEQQGSASGYLAVPELEVDVKVEDLTQTKALDFEVEAPSVSDIRFIVRDKDGVIRYDARGLWSEPLVLPVGTYSVEAVAGENGFGAPYFTGSFSGSISALDAETPVLKLSLANALVNVTVAESMLEHFIPGSTVSLNGDAYEAAYGEWFYVPSGQDVTLSLSGRNSAGKDVTFTHTLASPSPKTAYAVTCDQKSTDWPSIALSVDEADVWGSRIYITAPASFSGNISAENQAAVVYEALPASASDWSDARLAVSEGGALVIKGLETGVEYQVRARVGALVSPVVSVIPQIDGLTASAVHTLSAGELDGTDVTSVFGKSAAVRSAVESWTIAVCKADGTELRSGLSLGTSDGSAITATDGWPYLPVGSGEQYVLKASAVMDGQTYSFDDIELTMPAVPDFSLTSCAYTSYDKYAATNGISKDVTGANNCDPSTLYNAGARWGISINLMKNVNYQKTLVIDIDGDRSRTYTVSGFDANEFYENITGLSWQAHTHQVSFTFDGKTVTSPKNTHHITGLPYRAAPPTNTGDHPWTEDQRASAGLSHFNWGTSEFYMYDDATLGTYLKIGTPSFHVPYDIPVSVVTSAHGCKHASLKYDVDCRIHSGQSTVDFTAKYNNGNYSDYSINTLSLYPSSPKLQFESRHHTAYRKLYINKVMISYR